MRDPTSDPTSEATQPRTTPQAKRRFKYLSCINKDYWLIDWLR